MDMHIKLMTPINSLSLSICKTCGCNSQTCSSNNNLELHKEIQQLNALLEEVKGQRSASEHVAMKLTESCNAERVKANDDFVRLRDRYDRLFENCKKIQKLNHDLEENLLYAVEKLNSETAILKDNIHTLNGKIILGNEIIFDLEEECEEYRKDCNIASSLLQCNPTNFISHKISTLPIDLQERVRVHMTPKELFMMDSRSKDDVKETIIPIPTFPPTAMMFAIPMGAPSLKPIQSSNDLDQIPTRLLADVLYKSTRRKKRKSDTNSTIIDIEYTQPRTNTKSTSPWRNQSGEVFDL